MSPRSFAAEAAPEVITALRRVWVELGVAVRDARLAKHWSVADLAARAGVSRAIAYAAEAGEPTSLETIARLSAALGRRLDVDLLDPRRSNEPRRRDLTADLVHSAMGEFEARHLRRLGFAVGMDEPYQHYQFAGRADVVAWDLDRAALLHIENRTRFPDFQEMAGAYNAKRAYLGAALAARLGVRAWASETHVMAALWSSEVLHALRLRTESFRSLCPAPPDAWAAWWEGRAPTSGSTSVLVVLDPGAAGRHRPFLGLETARGARPRYRGYAEAASRLAEAASRLAAAP